MQASVDWDHGLTFSGTSDTGFTVPLGASASVGGDDDGFRPIELMLVSLAGCTAMDVISILQKKRQEITGFRVSVDAERAEEHPKVFTAITVHYEVTGRNVDSAAVERAIELSETRYCPAQAMLDKAVPIEHKYTITEETIAEEQPG
jgi:putative redox protein